MRASWAFNDFKFDFFSFIKRFVPFGLYRGVVNENILAIHLDKAPAFTVIEKFDCTFWQLLNLLSD